jgi:DNA-directed RNA polymerase subunit RPC12/RpoP
MAIRNEAMKKVMEKFSLVVVGYVCEDCRAVTEVTAGTERKDCPHCGSTNLFAIFDKPTKH